MYKDFRDMTVWKNAMHLAELIFINTANLPRCEDYGFTSQIRRAALSISANIAEAFGRSGNLEKAHFYYIARGSLMETMSHLEYGLIVHYIREGEYNIVLNKIELIHLELNKVIKSFKMKRTNYEVSKS